MLAADANEGVIATRHIELELGQTHVPAVQTSYRVRVGAHIGVLRTIVSDQLAWAHVGRDIVTNDGRVLFKAEVIEVGHGDDGELAAGDPDS